jgi:putative heme-binding domain-containing protein
MHGQGSAAHVYDRIPMTADHLHHEGEWTDRRNFRDNAPGLTDDMGGGHSHCGAMIYLGDNWPEKYRDTIFMSNTHGRRVNHDILKRKGSGYIGIHGKDFMKANQPWYRGVTQIYGPDGGVYFSDWTDFGECHDNDGVHRTSGRIYKVVYGEVGNPGRLDLSKKTSLELVACQLHHNEWYVRHARRLLQERFVAGANLTEAREELLRLLEDEEQPVDRQLRFLWSLHTTGGLVPEKLTQLLQHKNEHMRSWAVRLIGEGGAPNSEQFALIRNIASNGESKLARLYVASTFPRFTEAQQWTLAEDLLVDFGYTEDQNLPCMIWYALRPLVGADPVRGLELLSICRDPQVYKNIVRRIASDFDLNTELMPRLITSINATLQDGHIGIAVAGVKGIEEALNGLKGLTPPENWDLLASSQETLVSSEAAKLLPVFDQGEPMAAKDWLQLIDNQTRRNQAIRKLAAFDDPKIALTILKPYPRYLTEDKEVVISTLSSRVEYARPLLNAVENGQVPSRDISAFHARQIHNLGNQQLKETLEKVWGKLRQSPVEKQEEIASWQSKLTPERLSTANLSNGKLMFDRACASCHMIYGEGGALGPHLDGSDRKNLFYLLENLIDPSAVLPQDYRMTVITLNDGRVLSGNITEQTRHAITLAGLSTVEVIPLAEVVKQEQLEQSTMPEGLLQTMSENEVTDLIAFLQQ